MKVIFLDFDGVITIPDTKWDISLKHIKRVKEICDKTGAKLVISSSWQRCGRNGESRKARVANWLNETLMKDIKGPIKDFFEDYTYDMSGRFYSEFGDVRGSDIKSWLTRNPDVDNYVIIDDDGDMLDEQLFNFVQTDWAFGIQDREVQLAIDVLNNTRPRNYLSLNNELKFKFLISIRHETVDNYNEIVN